MKTYLKIFLYSIFITIGCGSFFFSLSAGENIGTPIIRQVRQDRTDYVGRPLVTGLVPYDSEVMIYVDGTYNGNAAINRENTGTDNFYYQIKNTLENGEHTIAAIAKNRTSLSLSSISTEYQLYVKTNTPTTRITESISTKALPAPTLIQPDEKDVIGKFKPFIAGLSVNNTFVHVYIDGKYNGKTKNLTHNSGTANFKYVPFLNLAPGWHTAWAKAEDAKGKISGQSNVLHFRIEQFLPAPTIIFPKNKQNAKADELLISGVAKNNLKIRIFIDKKLNGEFYSGNHVSGTTHFNYKPFLKLESGRHMVYATAIDARGKESPWSNITYFEIKENYIKPISKAKEEPVIDKTPEKTESTTSIEKPVIDNKTKDVPAKEDKKENAPIDEKKNTEKSDNTQKKNEETVSVNPDIKDILNPEASSTEISAEKGSIDETKAQQGKIKLNLIVFIAFLFLVMGWIFWVNRELIKERREQNEKDKGDSDLN